MRQPSAVAENPFSSPHAQELLGPALAMLHGLSWKGVSIDQGQTSCPEELQRRASTVRL